jgi:hypothetical protein
MDLSPYGSEWDVLWLGFCHETISPDRPYTYTMAPDPSVPHLKHLHTDDPETLAPWPPHTRIVHFSGGPICTYAYAVSQKGARKLLYSLSVDSLAGPFDNALMWWCQENDVGGNCISAQPPYFYAHRFAGGPGKGSDIQNGTEARTVAETWDIRMSARLNAARLLRGDDPVDAYPDDAPATGTLAGNP